MAVCLPRYNHSCPVSAFQMGLATWAVWEAITKYNLYVCLGASPQTGIPVDPSAAPPPLPSTVHRPEKWHQSGLGVCHCGGTVLYLLDSLCYCCPHRCSRSQWADHPTGQPPPSYVCKGNVISSLGSYNSHLFWNHTWKSAPWRALAQSFQKLIYLHLPTYNIF